MFACVRACVCVCGEREREKERERFLSRLGGGYHQVLDKPVMKIVVAE